MTAMVKYEHAKMLAKKPLFNFLGRKFWIYGPDGSTQFFVQRKAFKLKEDIKVYGDESKNEELLAKASMLDTVASEALGTIGQAFP